MSSNFIKRVFIIISVLWAIALAITFISIPTLDNNQMSVEPEINAHINTIVEEYYNNPINEEKIFSLLSEHILVTIPPEFFYEKTSHINSKNTLRNIIINTYHLQNNKIPTI